MNLALRFAAGVLAVSLAACSDNPAETGNPDGGAGSGVDASENPVIPPDAGSSGNPDGGQQQGAIKVTCTAAPTVVKLNQGTAIDCTIDNGGAPTTAPAATATPSAGVNLKDRGAGSFIFTLSTGTAGYSHPIDFADTTYTVTVSVKDANDASRFGSGTVTVTVLGNLWVGDSSASGKGVLAMASDGSKVGQAIGPLGVTGVYGLLALAGGDVAVSSESAKTIKIFDRKGTPLNITFETTDLNGANIWNRSDSYPRGMALSSTNELWVAGAYIANVGAGLAVFNPGNGQFKRFVPGPSTNSLFFSVGRRDDGTMFAVGSGENITAYDEKTYAQKASVNVDSGSAFFSVNYASVLGIGNGDLLAGLEGSSEGGVVQLNSTLAVTKSSGKIDYLKAESMAIQGDELLVPNSFGGGEGVRRFELATLKELTPKYGLGGSPDYIRLRGIVKIPKP